MAYQRIKRAAKAQETRLAYCAALVQLDGEDLLDEVLQMLTDLADATEQTGVDAALARARDAIDRGPDAARIRRRTRGGPLSSPAPALGEPWPKPAVDEPGEDPDR